MLKLPDILFYVEDPGAANFITALPKKLTERGYTSLLFANRYACSHLSARGVTYRLAGAPQSAERLLQENEPQIVIVGTAKNPDSLGLKLILSAKTNGIVSIAVVDAFMNADERFKGKSDDPLYYSPDWLLVTDPTTQKAFMELGFRSEKTVVCGHPHFDYVRSEKKKYDRKGIKKIRNRVFPKANPEEQIVIFATEGAERLMTERDRSKGPYTIRGRGGTAGRSEIVLEEFLEVVKRCGRQTYLVLRLHPKDTPGDYQSYLEEFDAISSGGNALESLYAADVVVGMTSMLVMEAVLLGKDVISVRARETELQNLPMIGGDDVCIVTDRTSFERAIDGLLNHGNHRTGKSSANNIPCGSTERMIDFIERRITDLRQDSIPLPEPKGSQRV